MSRRDETVDESLQQETLALGDPTRRRIYRLLADARQPGSVAEPTAQLQLNRNAARRHLAVPRAAHLVVEEGEAGARPGRPRLLYRLRPEVAERWEAAGSYPWLAGLLASAIRGHEEPRQVGREESRQRAAQPAFRDHPTFELETGLARLGFRPTRSERGPKVVLVLGRCPSPR